MKYLITYGDDAFKESRERIRKEAEALHLFDKIIIYTPDDLPDSLKSHPVFTHGRGGLWMWKAYLTLKTLREINDGDILFYVDCGSSLYPSSEWDHYFRLLERKDILAFQIVTRCGAYSKRTVIDHFSRWLGPYWGRYYQVAATLFFMKKSAFTVAFAEEWLSLFTERLCIEPMGEELKEQYKDYVAHRWDQSLLSGVVYKYADRIAIITNNFENRHKGQAIWASRKRDGVTKKVVNERSWIEQHLRRPIGIMLRATEQQYWKLRNKIYLRKSE